MTARGQQPDRDRYGGWTGKRFAATGWFRLEKDSRWWLVTPDGNAFLSLGLNHATPGFLQQPYNAEHWRKRFGASSLRDERFTAGFRDLVVDDMEAFGFNTFGCHTPARALWRPSLFPYVHTVKSVDIDHWKTPAGEDFLDVFAPAFERHCETRATEAGIDTTRDDPYLIGYAFTDCPVLTERDAASRPRTIYGAPRKALSTWPRTLRNLAAEAPGKQAYVRLMRERYAGDVRAFNRAYDTAFDSFEMLGRARGWRPVADPVNAAEERDNNAFLEVILGEYYRAMAIVIRRRDPHHLILGDKLNGNTDTPNLAVEAAARYVDVVFYQWYGYYGEQKARLDEWSKLTGKPLLNGDSSFSTPSEEMPQPLGPQCPTQEARAAATLDFAEKAFARPDFIGWHYCGWVDSWRGMPGKEIRQHSGLQDPFGNRYEPMVRALKGFSGRMYELAA